MAFVRLTDVHQGQHHEDEGLQGDDHDVEDRPSGTGQQVQDAQRASDTGNRACLASILY